MSDSAYELYLDLVDDTSLDCLGDGESAAIALAATLGHGIVLDDRKARRVHAQRFSQVPLVSSVNLLALAGKQDTSLAAKLPGIVESAIRYARMAILREERHLVDALIG